MRTSRGTVGIPAVHGGEEVNAAVIDAAACWVLDQLEGAGLVVWLDGGWGSTRCSAARPARTVTWTW